MNVLDFENDLKRELKRVSASIGFKIAEHKSLSNMLMDYLTVRTKIIEPKQRRILINPLFSNEIPNHPKREEIEFIIHSASIGSNLNSFQSQRLLQANFHDHLQNEWNIFHFHLSLKKEKKSKFVKQVNSLLFSYIDEDQIVFLGTDIHKDGIFGDIKWIEILHDFFPYVIKRFKDGKLTSIAPKVNAQERQSLWNKGYTLGMTEVRGLVYHNPGIGRMTTGHSMINSKTSDGILRWIYKLTEQVTSSHELLCNYFNIEISDAKFKIRFRGPKLELYEEHTNEVVVTFPDVLIEKDELAEKIKNA